MTHTPATYSASLSPATDEEIKLSLKPLFAQFPSTDGHAAGKILGYVVALRGEPKWAVDKAIARFLGGYVEDHDGRFLPTSAELAREVRKESDHARKIRAPRRPVVRRMRGPGPKIDCGGGMLTREEMRSCPVGTRFHAEDATIHYPDGTVETWGAFRRRRASRKDTEAA